MASVSISAQAAEVIISYVHITRIQPTAAGEFYLNLSSDHANCMSGSSPKRYWVIVGQNGTSAEGAKNLYAAALFAKATGGQVSVLFEDSLSSCAITRILLL